MPDPLAASSHRPTAEVAPSSAFEHTRFHFTSGIPSGDKATIRDRRGMVLLSYRSFASVVGIVASLVAGVVLLAGLAGVTFLFMEGRLLPAIAALVLSVAFTAVIVMLVPSSKVTIYEGSQPALTVTQQTRFSFPAVTWLVNTPDGQLLGRIRRGFLSRFSRDRWALMGPSDTGPSGLAIEESLIRSLQRKLAGKFNSRYQSNIRIRYAGSDAGTIQRRPTADGTTDVLDLAPNCPLDRRLAVALATLVLGSEP